MNKCKHCGAALKPDDRFCADCGTEAAAEEQQTGQEVHFVYDAQDAPQTTAQEASSLSAVPAVKAQKKAQKNKIGKRLAAAAACLILAGAAVFAGSRLRAGRSPSEDPQAYLRQVLEAELQKQKTDVLDLLYQEQKTEQADAGRSFDAGINIELGTLATGILSQLGLPISVNGLSFDLSYVEGDGFYSADAQLGLNQEEIASLEAVYNNLTKQLNLRIPELSSSYLRMDFSEFTDALTEGLGLYGYDSSEGYFDSPYDFTKKPERAELDASTDLYIDFFVSRIPEDVQYTKDVSVSTDGLSAKYDQYTITLTYQDLLDLEDGLLDTLEADALVQKLLEDQLSGTDGDPIVDLRNRVDAARDYEQKMGRLLETAGSLSLYLDQEDQIQGMAFEDSLEGGRISFYSIENQEDHEVKVSYMEDGQEVFTAKNQYKLKGKAKTGSFTIAAQEYDALSGDSAMSGITVDYQDFLWNREDAVLKGQMTVTSTIPQLSGMSLLLDFDCTGHTGTITADVKFTIQSLLKVTLTLRENSGAEAVKVDESQKFYDVSKDPDSYEEYLSDTDLQGFLLHIMNRLGMDLSSMLYLY